MAENERIAGAESNPYDRLMEPERAPVNTPVIFGRGPSASPAGKEKTLEMTPLASDVIYDNIKISEYTKTYTAELQLEEDLLVPDVEPDMDMILNVRGCVDGIQLQSRDSGPVCLEGEIKLETVYRSAESYGNPICTIPATMKLVHEIKEETNVEGLHIARIQVIKIESRILNERKYKVKLHINIVVKRLEENNHKIFKGIKGQPLQVKNEKINFTEVIGTRQKITDISEELLLNDEKIRPVKILKYKCVAAENHRQLTNEKLIYNETIWVRILYLAEIASKGNLSNQAMWFHGKLDNTHFIPLGQNETGATCCRVITNTDNLKVEVNRESNGFKVEGEITADVEFYGSVEQEIITDFYHEKEDVVCDKTTERICSNLRTSAHEYTLRDSLNLQQDPGDGCRIIYADGIINESSVDEGGMIHGKLQVEVVTVNDGDYTAVARKICDFSFMAEQGPGVSIENIYIREMTADLTLDNKININVVIHADIETYDEVELVCIENPCIVRDGEKKITYPITIYTVKEKETLWDISKRFKVSGDQVIRLSDEDSFKPGNKIVIVK